MRMLVRRRWLFWIGPVSCMLGGWVLGLCAPTISLAAVAPTAFGLPDGRVYEMASPAEDDDADVDVPYVLTENQIASGEGGIHTRLPFQAATDGDAVAYVGDSTVGGTGSSGEGLGNEYLARRGSVGGWHQVNLQPLGDKSAYYQAFSSDLSVGVVQQGNGVLPPLSEAAPAGYKDLYLHPTSDGGDGSYRPFFSVTPPNRSSMELSGLEFRTFGFPMISSLPSLAFAGGSVGLGSVLFEANDALTAGAVDGGPEENNLYVSVGGRLGLVNVLPDGVRKQTRRSVVRARGKKRCRI